MGTDRNFGNGEHTSWYEQSSDEGQERGLSDTQWGEIIVWKVKLGGFSVICLTLSDDEAYLSSPIDNTNWN